MFQLTLGEETIGPVTLPATSAPAETPRTCPIHCFPHSSAGSRDPARGNNSPTFIVSAVGRALLPSLVDGAGAIKRG